MKYFVSGSVIALTSALAAPVMADITAQEVWKNTQTWIQIDPDHPPQIGSVTEADGTLTVSNITLLMDEDDITATAIIPQIVFTEQSDGSVVIDLPDVSTVKVSANVPDGDNFEIEMEIRQPGSEYVVSGTDTAQVYNLTAPLMEFAITDFKSPQADLLVDVTYAFNDLSALSNVVKGNLLNIASTFAIGSVDVDFNLQDKSTGEGVKMDGTVDSIDGTTKIVLPLDPGTATPEDLMQVLDYDVIYTAGAADYDITGRVDGMAFQGAVTAAGTQSNAHMNQQSFGISAAVLQLATSMTSNGVPFPIEYGMDRMTFDLAMPLDHETEGDLRFGLGFIGTTISNGLWNLVDPGEVLPRDPITIDMLISSKGKWLFDLFDPDQAAALENSEMPIDISSATIERLNIAAVGAQLTGSGGFTFDNTDFMTIPGVPRPEGKVDLKLIGGNGLMDKLVSLGILSSEDVFGARMMMGIFTRPGDGDDTVLSTLEINEQGHISANGQRLQ